jgi:hypothetical protein
MNDRLDIYRCTTCNTHHDSRTEFQAHKATLAHILAETEAEMCKRDWLPVKTPRPTLRAARVPHEYRQAESGPQGDVRLYRNFVPRIVADAVADWQGWSPAARKKTPLKTYLHGMFSTVYTDAEVTQYAPPPTHPAGADRNDDPD